MMRRELIIRELQGRLNDISIVNGYLVDVAFVFRNPDKEPSPEIMTCVNIFEMEDTTIGLSKRGASLPPVATKNMRVVLEMWGQSASAGRISTDVSDLLNSVRKSIFNDGITLGGVAKMVTEVETSRMFRPKTFNFIGGIGTVIEFIFIEDYSNL